MPSMSSGRKSWAQRVHQDHVADLVIALRPAPHRIGHRPRHRGVGDQALPDVQPGQAVLALDRGARILVGDIAIARRLALFGAERSEEHTSELQSLMRTSYAVFCLTKTIRNIHYTL